MISLKTLIIEYFVIKVALSACPKDVNLTPCICYDVKLPDYPLSQVRCGDLKTDFTAADLKTALDKVIGDFDILYIHDTTTLDKIIPDTVTKATFKKIFIENNAALKEIELTAFSAKVQPQTLAIRNNALFVGTHIFEIAKANGSELIHLELNHNSIGDIPNDALNKKEAFQKLQIIRLDHNKLTKIGSNAIKDLPNLLQLSLDYNAIVQIGDPANASHPGIDLTSVTKHVSVFLNNNALPSTELVVAKIKLPDAGSVGLVLEDNSVPIDLKASKVLFAAIASKTDGKVYLHNKNSTSQPTCNCADITEITSANVKTHIMGVVKCTKEPNATIVPLDQCV